MTTFTPARQYKLLWKLVPEEGKEGHGLAATNENYARVQSAPSIVTIGEPERGIVRLNAINTGVLTSWQDGGIGRKWVVVPKTTTPEETWMQEFMVHCVQGNGIKVDAKTGPTETWERLRGGGYGQWIERGPARDQDDEYWRPEPTEVSASVTYLNGVLGIDESPDATLELDDWWMSFKLKNSTGKVLTVTYENESPQTVPIGQEFVIIPKGTDPTDRSVDLSVPKDDLALITLKMTKKGAI